MTAIPRIGSRLQYGGAIVPIALVAAAAAGALSTVKPTYGFALVGAIVVMFVVARDISSLPYFLVFTMFIESVSLGPGLRIGRVAGALALLVLALTLLTRGRAGLRVTPLMAVAGGYGLWIVASTEWAWSGHTVPTVAFSYLLSASYALTFAVLIRRPAQLFGAAKVLALGSTIFGLVAFAYYVRHVGTASAGDATGARAAGLQGDPNYFAIFQVIALPPALVLAATGTKRRRWFYFGAVGVIVISVVSSLSRTGLIALTVSVLLTLVLPWRIFFSHARQKVTYFIAISASAALAGAIGSTALVQRVQTILNPNAQGSYRGAGRQDLWRAALTGWHQSNEWIGMGAGNFKLYSLDLLQRTPGVDTTQNYAQNAREVHNAYLENLTDLGVIGLTIFVLVIVLTGRSFYKSFVRARAAGRLDIERFSLAFLVSLVGYAISAVFLSNQLAKALWILVGFALALDVMTRRWEPLVAAMRSYDRRVGHVPTRDDRMQRELQALTLAQQRLDRRREALDERERELEARAAASTGAPDDAVANRGLARLEAQVAALEKLLAAREDTIAALRASVAETTAPPVLPVEPEPEPTPETEPAPQPEPAAAPAPTPAPEPVPPAPAVDVLEVAPGSWSLPALESAVARYPDDERLEEWQTYAVFLRDQADAAGVLPPSFDALVWEVYGDLIARVRSA